MHSEALTKLANKLSNKPFILGVIGLGYVGRQLILTFMYNSIKVIGFDRDPVKIAKIERGQIYINRMSKENLAGIVIQKLFTPTTNFSQLVEPDRLLICVPTPLTANRDPDPKYIKSTVRSITKFLKPGLLVAMESTPYPGTTVEEFQLLLEENGLQTGLDCGLAFFPEREDSGNPLLCPSNIPKVVGRIDSSSSTISQNLYATAMDWFLPVCSTKCLLNQGSRDN